MSRGYGKSHIWVEEGQAGIAWQERDKVGISQHAADELGEVVYVSVDVGVCRAGDVFGTIESVKTAVDLIAPCDMAVMGINPDVETNPGLLNKNPEETPVAFVVDVNTDQLMTKEEYLKWLGN